MRNMNIPETAELPTMAKLIESTIIAICTAALILVTVVLPAEYGIDPTGAGEAIGLLKMGEIKVSLAEETAAENTSAKNAFKNDKESQQETETEVRTSDVAATEEANGTRTDERTLTLSPNQGREIKLVMKKGAQANYSWSTSGGRANFDAHADSKALKIDYHSYEKGSLERNEGILEAAFDGHHG